MIALFYGLAARSVRLRRMTGTVSVTSVGMFGGGGGFGIGLPTIQTLTVLVGGISRRPWVIDGEIVPRDILDLTVTVDHNVVDGAPAARFVADLRRMIESPGLVE
jgi:pyruvate/2-oxoglutarate dehydrogenase complex dihydrolipoamide acyltransferase (E2) component